MKYSLFVLVFFCFPLSGISQHISSGKDKQIYEKKILWSSVKEISITDTKTIRFLFFDGATYNSASGFLPEYFEIIRLKNGASAVNVQLTNEVFEEFDQPEIEHIENISSVENEITVASTVSYERKNPYAMVSFVPVRKNKFTGKYEKLVSFTLVINPAYYGFNKTSSTKIYAANSVLSSGNWYKTGLIKDGIYKLSYSFLQSLGMAVSSINPQNIRVYGNGGGMLPYLNSAPRYDDLVENAIQVVGEEDGVFNANDYVLFYGQGAAGWSYDTVDQKFHHQVNLYSDTTWYFITADLGAGKRISSQASEPTFNTTVSTYDDYAYNENDLVNLLKSGREWYGESFDILTSYDFSFNFPNIDASSPVYLNASVIGRAIQSNLGLFSISANGQPVLPLSPFNVDGYYTMQYAVPRSGTAAFSSGSSIGITVSYDKQGVTDSRGWLNYIELNARRQLIISGDQMPFRDINSVGSGIVQFQLTNANSSIKVWEVTDPMNVKEQLKTLTGSVLTFNFNSDSLREFIAFNGASYFTPTAGGVVINQDLHGLTQQGTKQPDLIIVTHPSFLDDANRLADLHRDPDKDSMVVKVVTVNQIYNEFSSGAQDISAIRDFTKMLYDRAGSDTSFMPKYLLLFGDGSYDNKNRLAGNTNFLPTYQSADSYNPTSTYVTDDFYGLLDDNEGEFTNDLVDIGVGRLPVKSTAEAKTAVDKIDYYTYNSATMRDWRNIVCFVGDDEDSNLHTDQADQLATLVDTVYDNYNIDKIYSDAYIQQSTPGGQRYPDVNDAINKRVEKGAFIINYTGHGGEVGWAHERILEVTDINNWDNLDNMPVFVTATCEFSRFDDPERTSAGEYVFLNPNGGGIALLSTVRLVYSSPNFTLNQNFYYNVFEEINGEMPRLGDLFRLTKRQSGTGVNNRNFTLLGDPALRMAYPEHVVITDSINGNLIMGVPDTLKALRRATISGHIEDKNGNEIGFNGIIYPTVYDKAATLTTLKNDPGSSIMNFTLQKNVLFRGKVSVVNGKFSFQFVVPKDINYKVDYGRISYYAENGVTDATGYNEDFIIGGTAAGENDVTGPEIDLYLNDTTFVFGGMTDENPILLAFVKDLNGVNTTGNSIGHDIVAVLDGETNQSIVLNDDYESDLDSYQKGSVKYAFKGLSEGKHTLELTVWDTYNNSSKGYTEFIVAKSAELTLGHVFNYPNPFTTYTEFWFEHNRPGESLDVQIQIFTVSGKLVKTIHAGVLTEGFRPEPIKWNGLDDFGDKIGRGVYIYRLKVRSVDGSLVDKYQKLVILN